MLQLRTFRGSNKSAENNARPTVGGVIATKSRDRLAAKGEGLGFIRVGNEVETSRMTLSGTIFVSEASNRPGCASGTKEERIRGA